MMTSMRFVSLGTLACAVLSTVITPVCAQEGAKKKVDVDAMVEKGLDWLKRT